MYTYIYIFSLLTRINSRDIFQIYYKNLLLCGIVLLTRFLGPVSVEAFL